MNKIFKVGLIGCGHISETYFRAEKYFNNIKIVKCADINLKNALKCAPCPMVWLDQRPKRA